MKATSEYRNADWALVVLDYFLQQIEAGMNATEAQAATESLCDRLSAALPENDFAYAQHALDRIARLLPAADLFGSVTWADEDIEQEFELLEIERTPERIAAVRKHALKRDRLQDAQIQAGFAVIRACIEELYGEED